MFFMYVSTFILNRFSSFSCVKNGLELALTILGIMAFLLAFKQNLHSMVVPEEQPLPQKSYWYLNLISCFLLFAFILILFFQFIQIQNINFCILYVLYSLHLEE